VKSPAVTRGLAAVSNDRRFRVVERRMLQRATWTAGLIALAALIVGTPPTWFMDPAAALRITPINIACIALTAMTVILVRSRWGLRHVELLVTTMGLVYVADIALVGWQSPQELSLSVSIMPMLPLLFALFMPLRLRTQLILSVAATGFGLLLVAAMAAQEPLLADGASVAIVVGFVLSLPGNLLLRRLRYAGFVQLRELHHLHLVEAARGRTLAGVNAELETSARIDALTGIGNRLRLREDFDRHAGRTDTPTALIMLDLDHFKRYNDALGHVEGDEVLRRVAHLLSGAIRPRDIVYRYGGEEFLILLPDTDLATASTIAERLREAVATEDIGHPARPDGDRVTLSAGVAAREAGMQTSLSRTLRSADAALYRAKRLGRDRVEIHDTAVRSLIA
jgi:two-component system, chemotaxis family, response regulator WspR